ncbi:hypothetical protein BDV98DRAFT_440375 [Pterulicium gracile]|uniref:Uncharacterized protein n=1 Tax=Pterulicium gracile TaxID=1884261 RepID=A0A5C3Q2B3_9AGAR|nr:hypothetical protein BDV98DRAFT_440375 [Pterula gracilis]
MCLGSQLTFTVTFKRAFEIEGEVFEAKSIEVVDGSAASLDDCPLAAQDAGSANEITDADRSSSKDGVPAIIAEQLPPSDPTSSTFTPHCNYTSSEAAPVSPGLPLPHQGSVPVGLSAKKVEAPAIADEGAASRRDGNSSAGGDQSVVRKETCKFTLVHGDVLMLFGSELEVRRTVFHAAKACAHLFIRAMFSYIWNDRGVASVSRSSLGT